MENFEQQTVDDPNYSTDNATQEPTPRSTKVNDNNNITGSKKAHGEASYLRGALKIETSTSTPTTSAGSEFSIYVVIRNPFSVPVTIYSTETHIPIELTDEIWRKLHRQKISVERHGLINNENTEAKKFILRLNFWFQDFLQSVQTDPGPRVAVAVSPEVQDSISKVKPDIRIHGELKVERDFIGGDRWDLDFASMPVEKVRQILFDINEYINGRSPVILNAGDSVVKHFILKTTRWLTFAPIAHTFQIQVRYEIEDEAHIDTVPFTLNIRSAIGSSMIGAVIGSLLGSFVSPKYAALDPAIVLRTFLTAMVFAVIVVVAFARKSNVQQIVSIEDFWGGIFIGFLVGYSGETFINTIIATP